VADVVAADVVAADVVAADVVAADVVAADVVVVGGGVGGLCAAIRLQAAGHRVTVLERNAVVGGKLAVRERDGFTFDIGPSLLTMPQWFDEVFRLAGTSLADELELVRLNPQFRYTWPDGSSLTIPDGVEAATDAVEEFAPGEGAAFGRFLSRARTIWDISERTFFAGPMESPVALLRRMRSPRDLIEIDAMQTLAKRASSTFRDPRLVQWVGRYATYSGSSPFRAPATLGCIPHLELAHGTWYPQGGLGKLRDALARVAGTIGVDIRTGADVASISHHDGRVRGVRLTDQSQIDASIVVANVDAEHLYADLAPDASRLRRVRRAKPSGSGFMVLAGVRGTSPGLAHHNVWFSPSYLDEYAELHAGRAAAVPTLYACVSSVTDPTQAPPGHENWFVLVNTPPDAGQLAGYEATVLSRVTTTTGLATDRIAFTEVITPADIEARYRARHGSIYGTSSDGRRAAFARPGNRGPINGLYLVGGTSHPGGGLPLVAASARIVADLIAQDVR
jgi:phytoene desaturase